MSEPVLCYVEGSCAYFTTQPLADQWGDDWDDAPYEHNAGTPYEWRADKWDMATRTLVPNDHPRWEIVKVYFDGDLVTPDARYGNSPFSVEKINRGDVPWLEPYMGHGVRIMAGCTVSVFKDLVREAGGRVYVEEANQSPNQSPTQSAQSDKA